MKRSSVVLADDDEPVLEVIRRLVEPHFDVLGTANDGAALCELVERTKPEVVLLDVSMPVMNGIEAVKRLRKIGFCGKLVFLTVHRDPVLAEEAITCGAQGYVLKDFADRELVGAIREALKGRVFLSAALKQ